MPPSDLNFEPPVVMPRLPEDRQIVTSVEAARRASTAKRATAFVGAEGSGPALVNHALSAAGARQTVYVVASNELGQQAAGDLAALAGGLPLTRLPKLDLPPPLVLGVGEATPYAELHADRRAAMLRTATLCELLASHAQSQVVLSAGALVRRVPPRRALQDATLELTLEQAVDTVLLSQKLTSAGYLRVPVVEDPGSYALRGGIVDIWPGQLGGSPIWGQQSDRPTM